MAAAPTLKKLTLTAFRGSTTTFSLDFEPGKRLTLIYGENGSGKTTICDAFEFLASEKVGSIEERGMGQALHKYWHAAGKTASDLRVDLETSATTCTGTVVNKKASVAPLASKPRIELLRQRQILELVQAKPGERYEEIKRFINIEAFEKSEESLRQLGKSLEGDKTRALDAENENLAALQDLFEAAGKPAGFNAHTWAKKRLEQPEENLDADIAAISKLRTNFDALAALPQTFKDRRAAVAAAKAALATAEQGLAVALAGATDGAGETLPVLQAGQGYLHAHPDASECPLCGSAENIGGLANAIDQTLQSLAALTAAVNGKQNEQAAVNAAEIALTQLQTDLGKAADALAATIASHTWRAEVALPAGAAPKDDAQLESWLATNAAVAATWPTVEGEWREEKKLTAALKSAVERYESNQTRRIELEQLIPKVTQALKECMEERQKFIDAILTEIAQDVGKLYEQVHPGEGLDKIALPLDPAKRASMELMAEFAGEEVPPQAYFSQSHLDTLGLCVFLALALRDHAANTVLILDDVVGSVDEPHVERVIGMLYEVSGKFEHTIVTTHYRLWREKYRWGLLKPGQPCQFVELTSWGIKDGMRLTNALPEIDRLKVLLAATPVDTQALCSKAGVILEAALDYLTQKYECSVPRRPRGEYTLGDLLPSINGKLLGALKVEIRDGITDPTLPSISTVELKPILEKLALIAQARNAMGAHFKAISFDLLDTDAVGFAQQVELLMDALAHPTDGWPMNSNSGSYWRNSGDSRRLHPLKKPS